MPKSYQQYLRAYAHVLSGGVVAVNDLMTVDGLDLAAIALGVLHAKRAVHRPDIECLLNVAGFAELLKRLVEEKEAA